MCMFPKKGKWGWVMTNFLRSLAYESWESGMLMVAGWAWGVP